ncbi:MAG: rod shape-determining protein MreC [Endomicrobium sp.]|jgi:rod shape-determining protein MreC|nr:rod shape-determining protein MreC [Endomicrobium sp.]
MHKTHKTRHGNLIFAVLLVFGLALIIGRSSSYVNLIKNLIYYIAYPNIATANNIFRSTVHFADNIKSMVFLYQENLAYEQKNQELEDKIRNYDIISKEYENLSKLLNLEKIKNTQSVFARIIAREPWEWYQWLIIDKGKNNNLKKELPVLVFNKKKNTLCAMGKILEVYKSSSKVVLITNPIYEFPVGIKDKGINCLSEGFNSNLVKITYIPSDADVKPGDEIVVSELSSVFPKDVPVGVIKEVMEESYVDFKTATAEVYFESNVIYDVVILVPQENMRK